MPDPLQSAEIGLRAVLDLSNMQKNSAGYKGILTDLQKVTQAFTNQSNIGTDVVSNAISGLGDMWKRVTSIIYGIVIADTFRDIEKAVGGMVQEAFDAVSVFQGLEIQFTTLAARNYAREFGGTAGDALAKVSGQAKELLLWVRQIAVTTPYNVANLGHMLALANAYGYTVEQAKQLILSVGNFTSAMGSGDDVAIRMVWSMGQMVAMGKPMNRELRELANAFVPVNQITQEFAERLGKTTLQIKAMYKSGQITTQEWIKQFESDVARDYPGAMARMSRTFVGVANNLKDLIQSMFGYEIFGPVADKISNMLQDMLQSFLTPQNYALAGAVGASLAFSYDKLAATLTNNVLPSIKSFFAVLGMGVPTVTDFSSAVISLTSIVNDLGIKFAQAMFDLSDTINSILSFFGTTMADLTNKMQTWGMNALMAFARGISSAVGFVLDALGGIATEITTLLEAHSAPEILPDLFQWGQAAMATYLAGFSSPMVSATSLTDLMASFFSGIKTEPLPVDIVPSAVNDQNQSLNQLMQAWQDYKKTATDSLNKVADIAQATTQKIVYVLAAPMMLDQLQAMGAGAINAYLEGFNEVDFSVFNTISNEIGNLMKSLSDETNPDDFVQNMVALDMAIAEATAQWQQYGEIASDSLDKIAQASGVDSDIVLKYLQTTFDLQKINSISDAVKSMFDFTGAFPVDIFGQAIDSFQELSNIAGQFGSNLQSIVQSYAADSMELVNVNNLIVASQTRVDAATIRVAEAQKELNVITQKYDDILVDLNSQLNKVRDQQEDLSRVKIIDKTLNYTILTDDEKKRLELEKQQILLQRQIRDTTEKKTADEKSQQAVINKYQEEQKAAEVQLKYYNDQKTLIDKRIKYEKSTINSVVAAEDEAAKKRVNIYKSMIDEQIKLNNLQKAVPPPTTPPEKPGGGVPPTTTDAELQAQKIKDQFDSMWKAIQQTWTDFWAQLTVPFAPLEQPWKDLVASIRKILDDPQFATSWDTFVSTVEDGFHRLGIVITTPGPDGKTIGTQIGEIFGIIVTNLFISTSGKPSIMQILADGFDTLAKTIQNNRETIDLIFTRLGELLSDHMFPKLKELLQKIVEDFLPKLLDFALKAMPPILTVLEFLVDHADTIIGIFVAWAAISALQNFGAGVLSDQLGKALEVLALIALLGKLKGVIPGTPGTPTTTPAPGTPVPTPTATPPVTFPVTPPVTPPGAPGWFEPIPQTVPKVATISSADIIGVTTAVVGGIITGFSINEILANSGINKWLASQSVGGGKTLGDFIQFETFDKIAASIAHEAANSLAGQILWGKPGAEDRGKEWGAAVYKWVHQAEIDINTWTTKAGEDISAWGIQAGKDITSWTSQAGKDISGFFESLFGGKGSVTIWLNTAAKTLSDGWNSLWGEKGVLATSLSTGTSVITNWWNGIFGEKGSIVTWFSTLSRTVDDGFNSIFGPRGTIDQIFNSMFGEKGIVTTWTTDFFNIGVSMLNGLWNGFLSMKDHLINSVGDIVTVVIEFVRAITQAHSDSIVFKNIGKDMMSGWAAGISESGRLPVSAIAGVMKMMNTSMSYGSGRNSSISNVNNVHNFDQRTYVSVNPTYENMASPVTIYSDVSAALSASRR